MLRLLVAVALAMTGLPPGQPSSGNAASLLISTAELAASLKDPALVVLHVADRPSVFEEAHIPGARQVRYADFAIDGPDNVGSELPPVDEVRRVFEAAGVSSGSRVVIYAATPVAAARAFFTLDVMGHPRVALLDGGLRAWRAEGRPIETGPQAAVRAGQFMPQLNGARLASAQLIQKEMPSSGIALVDVRPDPEFLGTETMGGAHAAGHIAGAKQLTWNSLVDGDGRFLVREQLQSRLASAGAVAGKPVVAYCMVGMRASVVYFVARHLGFDARLYDGSIVDWSKKKLPVVTGRQ